MKFKIYHLFLLLLCLQAYGQEEKTWDVNKPPGNFKDYSFTFDEGTWMNLDVSPDGKTIIFDHLGDIYAMPITGGDATLLRGGLAYEVQPQVQPRWSAHSFYL